MKHGDFKIGIVFKTNGGTWRCTDIGTRTVIAIKIPDSHEVSWLNGPPYAVSEIVFDENDLEACIPNEG